LQLCDDSQETLANELCVSAKDLQDAEITILKFVQKGSFAFKIDELEKMTTCEQNSNIRKNNPILDNGLLHIRDRLLRASMYLNTKHPITYHLTQNLPCVKSGIKAYISSDTQW
jgi:hypothetical protein